MTTATGKRIAIVTGSALGLGYELARQLIERGLTLWRSAMQDS